MDAPKSFSEGNLALPELMTEFMVDMKCEGCVNAVKSKLETVKGVKSVEVDLSNQIVRVLGFSPVKSMEAALEQTDRKARLIGQGIPEGYYKAYAYFDSRNNEVQFAGELQPRGCCYTLKIPAGDLKMLNRLVVKSESATIKIPELDFEIPPEAQRGSLSTVEGILTRAADGLEALQEERRKVEPKIAEAIDEFLVKLKACATGLSSFTFIQDDPAGNSFIENPM